MPRGGPPSETRLVTGVGRLRSPLDLVCLVTSAGRIMRLYTADFQCSTVQYSRCHREQDVWMKSHRADPGCNLASGLRLHLRMCRVLLLLRRQDKRCCCYDVSERDSASSWFIWCGSLGRIQVHVVSGFTHDMKPSTHIPWRTHRSPRPPLITGLLLQHHCRFCE